MFVIQIKIHYYLHSYCIVKQKKNLNRQNDISKSYTMGSMENNTLTWESYVII